MSIMKTVVLAYSGGLDTPVTVKSAGGVVHALMLRLMIISRKSRTVFISRGRAWWGENAGEVGGSLLENLWNNREEYD